MFLARFAGALVALAVSGATAAEIPKVGTATGDGFTVAAHWAYHYRSKGMSEGKAIGGPLRSLDAPLNFVREVNGDADVTEEVNKTNGEIRAVVRNGHWSIQISNLHYTDKYGTRVAAGQDASGGGDFKHAAIGYGHDDKLKKPTVSFAISASEDTEPPQIEVQYHPLDENFTKVWVSGDLKTKKFNAGVSGGCTVPFKQSYLYYRKRTPEDGSNASYTEIVIERLPRNLEAEIKPADDYKNWVPTLDGSAAFEVRMVDPPGLPADWQISLENVSQQPGVCNNANIDDFPALAARWQNAIKKNSPDLLFDFRRYGKTDKNFKPVSAPWKELHTTKAVAGASVAVSCLDWGASGRISAKAWVDGQPVEAQCRETKENFIRIPWAPNDQRENKMAAAATTWRGQKKYFARDPNSDDDDAPVGKPTCKGDGMTVFHEYRGFYVRRGGVDAAPEFIRLDPDHKDLFIYMFRTTAQLLWRHVLDFEKASALDVHRVGDDHLFRFVDFDSRIINFNSVHGDWQTELLQPLEKKQHGLYLAVNDLVNGHGGESIIGPPVNVDVVAIDWKQSTKCDSYSPNYSKAVVIHELGHAVGIDHHGNGHYKDNKGRTVAQEGGEYAGDMECAMKYVGASFYTHRSTGPVTLTSLLSTPTLYPYDPKHREKNGLAFCTNARGTGINDKSQPDWQCGDADLGNCAGQIVINDQCARRAGRTSGRNLPDAPKPQTLPRDASERTASDTQERANMSFELTVGGARKKEIIPGEASIFEVTLGSLPSNTTALEIGSTAKPWTEQIEFLVADKDGKLVPAPVKIRAAGKARGIALGGPAQQIQEETSPRVRLAADRQLNASFAIDAETSANLPPGTLRVFFGITPAGKTERVISNSVELVIKDPKLVAPGDQSHLDARRIFSQAQLAFADGHFAEAEALGRKTLAMAADSADEIHLLVARALEAQDKLKEAYDEYQASLAAYRPVPGVIDEPPYVTIFALRALEQKLGIERKPVAATIDMFFSHELYAETAGGKKAPPFPKTSARLGFSWKSTLLPGNDPLGVRWIAEDVPSAEKNHVISSAQSDLKKTEGEFFLTKPSAGFPPGQYRVEIWQSGKMIYSEKFEIKGE